MRPAELAADTCQLVDVLAHVLEEYEQRGQDFDNICLLWATAPMRTAHDIRGAYELLDEDTEAVVAVTDFDLPVFCALSENENGFLTPLFPDYQKLPSDGQPRVIVDSSSMCWTRVSAFREQGTWMPLKLKGYWMQRRVSVDIETEQDWELAEFYYRRALKGEVRRA